MQTVVAKKRANPSLGKYIPSFENTKSFFCVNQHGSLRNDCSSSSFLLVIVARNASPCLQMKVSAAVKLHFLVHCRRIKYFSKVSDINTDTMEENSLHGFPASS